MPADPVPPLDGIELVEVLATLANPHRLRVLAALLHGRAYVSQLARDLGISRPLLQVHLKRLQAVGLVSSELEISNDGKAMNYFALVPFRIELTPSSVLAAARSLEAPSRTSSTHPHRKA